MPNLQLMTYREEPPPPALSHLALSFWEFSISSEATGPIVHEVFPDGCASIVYFRNITHGHTWLHVVGPRLYSLKAEVNPGDVFCGVRLAPAAAKLILSDYPQVFNGGRAQLSLSGETHSNTKGLFDLATGFPETVKAHSSYLSGLSIPAEDIDSVVATAVSLIETHRGHIGIAELAGTLNLSARQLERRFRQAVGLPPKQFARLRRLRATIVSLVEQGDDGWAQKAAEMGFADQPHLTRDFGSLTGQTPSNFAEKTSRIIHRGLVK